MGGSRTAIWGRTARSQISAAAAESGTALPPSGVHVVAGQWMRQTSIRMRFSRQELEKVEPAAIEGMRRSREVNAPDPKLLLADFAPCRVGMGFQAIHPVPQRL